MQTQIIIYYWMIAGLANLILLYYIQKKKPSSLQQIGTYGITSEVGFLLVWTLTAGIIIPIIIFRYSFKQINYTLTKFVIVLKNKIR